MSSEDICKYMHHPGTRFPEVHPCGTPNGSNKKTHWSADALHCVNGCCTFKDYQTLPQGTISGKWVNSGEFPMSLGHNNTIHKANHGKSIDHTVYWYLNKVHIDIGFGDTMAVGGTCYVLVFVDLFTRYNWVFSLKSPDATEIQATFNLFRSQAGRFACFRADCD